MKTKLFYKCFFISGFTYNQGACLFNKLKVGKKLRLVAEPENRYDENAVAVYYKKHKIGFVPKEKNYSMSKFLQMGHNPFQVVIQQRNKHEHPERQIQVVVYVKEVKKDVEETEEISSKD